METTIFLLEGEIKKKNNSNEMIKKIRTKLKNKIMTNWDWMMKLKRNKTFTKRLTTKNTNKKNKD
jgi:hypothetical protein